MQLSTDDLNTWEELQAKAQGQRRLVTGKNKRAFILLYYTCHSLLFLVFVACARFISGPRAAGPTPTAAKPSPSPSPAGLVTHRRRAQIPAAPALFLAHGCWAQRPPPPSPAPSAARPGPSSPHTARFSFWPEPTAPTIRQTPDTGRLRLRFALPTQNRGVPLALASRPLAETAPPSPNHRSWVQRPPFVSTARSTPGVEREANSP